LTFFSFFFLFAFSSEATDLHSHPPPHMELVKNEGAIHKAIMTYMSSSSWLCVRFGFSSTRVWRIFLSLASFSFFPCAR
jgi:hypothetical protein